MMRDVGSWRAWCVAALLCGFSIAGGTGCADTMGGTGGSGGSGGSGGAGGSGPTGPLVVTADWLNQSLTLLDYDLLVDGMSTAEEAIVRTIDLSEWEPGPIELELTPDGQTAVVAVGPGFFDGNGTLNALIGSPDVPPGGTLLVVDIESGEAESIETAHVPMGIAISPDGTRAYTANFGTTDERGDTLSIIDLSTREVLEEITVGARPEQVVLSEDGTVGAVNITGANGIRVFETSDVAGTLTEVVFTGADPSDLAFLGDNSRLLVSNSAALNLVLLDTSDPSAPVVLDERLMQGGVPYGVTYVPSRDNVLAPTAPLTATLPSNFVTAVVEDDVIMFTSPASNPLPGGPFPLTAAADANGDFAFVAHAADQRLSIVDLESGAFRFVSWLAETGPFYVAVQR